MRNGLDEQRYCNNCWLDTFTRCFKCGKHAWKRLSFKVNETYFCSNCYTRSTYKEVLPSGGGLCNICGKPFEGKKGVHLHKSKSH